MPLDFSLDHMGPLTRSVRDAALTLRVLAGFDPRDDTSSRHPVADYPLGENISIRDLRIGLPENFYFDRVEPATAQAVRRIAETAVTLGARIIPIRVPDISAINTIGRIILLSEASALMERHLAHRENFGTDVLALLDQGRLLPATDYVNAQRLRRLAQQEFQVLWRQVDCLLTPTTPTAAPKIGQTTVDTGDGAEDVRIASTRLVRAINVLGLPALSMPCGFNGAGLPLGLQIIGPAFGESVILRVGAALEDATDHGAQKPGNL